LSVDAQKLSLATPERAMLSLPIAGIGSRTLAHMVDWLILAVAWAVAILAFSVVAPLIDVWGQLSSVGQVAAVLGVFATFWVYWTATEVLMSGQSPGKKLMGIRVVRQDGSPVGLFESAVRNLIRFVDLLPSFYAVGLVAMLIDKQNRRLGDLAAGTVLVRVEKVDLSRYETTSEKSAHPLSPQETEVITDFLARVDSLEPEARTRLSGMMVSKFLSHLSEADRATASADAAQLKALLKARL
jgi:uncharacterized RDD family membrane protein YckC